MCRLSPHTTSWSLSSCPSSSPHHSEVCPLASPLVRQSVLVTGDLCGVLSEVCPLASPLVLLSNSQFL